MWRLDSVVDGVTKLVNDKDLYAAASARVRAIAASDSFEQASHALVPFLRRDATWDRQ